MSPWYKNKVLVVFLILLVGGSLVLLSMRLHQSSTTDGTDNTEMSTSDEAEKGEVKVMGVISCLPYHINVSGQGCVKGIKGDDGKIYALNSPKGLENAMNEGTKVTAIGVYQSANTSVDESSVFRYDGVLVIRSLVRR